MIQINMNYKGALKIKKFSIVIILLVKYFILGTDLFAQDFSQAKRILENSIESGDLKMVTALVGNKDEEIFHASFGTLDKDGEANMTKDTITQIGSMTKLITTIAVLQLVEQGQIDLESEIHKYLPELETLKIIESFDNKKPLFSTPNRKPTVKELLTHTSGYAYEFANKKAAKVVESGLSPSIFENYIEALNAPLMFEPGKDFQYGIGIDWAGILVERVTKKPLNEYFLDNIFKPLGMEDTFFEIPTDKIDRTAKIWIRKETPLPSLFQRLMLRMVSFFTWSDFIYGPKEVQPMARDFGSADFYAGGGGLYSTTSDYAKILQMLLNNGKLSGNQILTKETIEKMFQNQIGDLEVVIDGFPGFGDKPKWGYGFMLHPDGTSFGRNAGSASWYGIYDTHFWIDPESELFGIFSSQVFSPFHEKTAKHFNSFETEIYETLKK